MRHSVVNILTQGLEQSLGFGNIERFVSVILCLIYVFFLIRRCGSTEKHIISAFDSVKCVFVLQFHSYCDCLFFILTPHHTTTIYYEPPCDSHPASKVTFGFTSAPQVTQCAVSCPRPQSRCQGNGWKSAAGGETLSGGWLNILTGSC